MAKAGAILTEISLAAGVALCVGTALTGGGMVYGRRLELMLQPAAVGAVWLGPALLGIWICMWAMKAVARPLAVEWSRADSHKVMRPLLVGFISLAQPLIGFANIALALLTLGLLAVLWRWWSVVRSSEAMVRLLASLESGLGGLGDGRVALAISVCAGIFYALVAAGLFAELPQPEGDEPHYLMIGYSMLADGDIELSENYYENRDYLRWHNYSGTPVGYAHTKKGKDGPNEEYSMHTAGLPVYLLPFLAASLGIGNSGAIHLFVRLGMVLPAAAFIGLLYLTLLRLGFKHLLSLGTSLLAGLTCPILFFSYHVFTELPAALLCLFAFYHLWPERAPGRVARVFVGLALGALPWLGPKYIFLAVPLGVLWLTRELRWGWSWRRVVVIGLPGLILGMWFFWHTYELYGTVNPAAYYVGATGDITQKNPVFKVSHAVDMQEAAKITGKTALSYWIDQKEGLLAFAPWYLLAIAGWIGMAVSSEWRRLALWLAGLAAPFYLLYSTTGFGGGHSPPSRAVTAIIWVFIIPAVWMTAKALRRARELTFALIVLSLIISSVLLLQPELLYHDFHIRASRILSALSTPFLDLTALAPSVNNKYFENWGVAVVWMVLLTAMIWWVLKSRVQEATRRRDRAGVSLMLMALVVVAWAWFGITPPFRKPGEAGKGSLPYRGQRFLGADGDAGDLLPGEPDAGKRA